MNKFQLNNFSNQNQNKFQNKIHLNANENKILNQRAISNSHSTFYKILLGEYSLKNCATIMFILGILIFLIISFINSPNPNNMSYII
ncbi:MAG: hypothetical protein LBM96_11490 [Methanobrevibacter sp.]|jgi:hypothetical protein|nr:hypothetical protein [Candidatus Methanoflexus mossambicus]